MKDKELLQQSSEFCEKLMTEKLDESVFRYHNLTHVKEMMSVATWLAESYQLPKEEQVNIELACWFHDVGYAEGAEGHEGRGVEIMKSFMAERDVPEDRVAHISDLIMATEKSYSADTLSEKIMKDADCFHVGRKQFWEKTALLKAEIEQVQNVKLSEKDWFNENLKFLHKHNFLTPVAQTKYNNRKRKNILKLQKRLKNLADYEDKVLQIDPEGHDMSAKLAGNRADRGIETMFRVTLRNHNNLSVIADNKANIMLSINAIMLSIVLSSLASKLDTNPALTIPTVILVLVCVVTVLLAVLATRPKILGTKYSDEKFLNKKFNILFFGNFHNLPLDKFEWGIKTLMNNEDMLYTSLSQDLYYLGLVLSRKYKLLQYCYNVFAIGIILAVIAFIWAFTQMGVSPDAITSPAE